MMFFFCDLQTSPPRREAGQEDAETAHHDPPRLRLGDILLLRVVLEAATGSSVALRPRVSHGCGGYGFRYDHV